MKSRLRSPARRLAPCLLWLAWIACAPANGGGEPANEASAATVACREPRPEVCTQEYRPVCGCTRMDCGAGEGRPYANACVACRNPEVEAYRPEPCEGQR